MEIMVHDNTFLRYARAAGKGGAVGDVWFIHGFGESGLSFAEAFDSPLTERFNLYVPDLPGFGASPSRKGIETVADSTELLLNLIEGISKDAEVYLVGHSLGGIIGTWAAGSERLTGRVKAFANIEGNLTRADTFATSLTLEYDDPGAFFEFFSGVIVSRLGEGGVFRRFLASLTLSDPGLLLTWGKSCVAATGETRSGEEYAALNIDTLYIWGDESTPDMTKDFIFENNINNREVKGAGHWVMIDKSKECYGAISDFFSERT
ncbi:MAG: alpha/beta fold hydrolase [Deltaproteobacteria bacterium]|uniref:Alpha/beta fold hydrolase n=1 Tax=Candidatus Zymogenus saltonus TaxID=2844893 RepID=A0A9D8KG47_9DELT|nr:alpha/beta fold hydrolase [Candidatus Zymogenus saltonus]